jgi:two-component system, LytTR family, sensor kinase
MAKLLQWQDRWSLFWLLQLIGWTGYTLDRWIQGPRYFFPVSVIYILLAFGLTLCLRPIYRRVWRASPSLLQVSLLVLLCSVAAGFLWLAVSDAVFWLTGIRGYKPNLTWVGYLRETFIFTLSHHKPFLFLSWSALYFGFKYWQEQQRQHEQALRAAALAKEAELQMLRYQLNPHFLFNTPNSASALIREDAARAEVMVNELSEFLRYALTGAKQPVAPLRDEIEAVRNYLAIEKIRFEDKLDARFEIAPEATEFRVPSLLLHPLVENAVKYGMQTSALPLRVEIKAWLEHGDLQLEVLNSGRWLAAAPNGTRNGAGIGLHNVRQRLEQAFPQQHQFEVGEQNGQVRARLQIQRQE